MTNIQKNKIIDTFFDSKGEYHPIKDQWGAEVWAEYKPHNYHSDWNVLIRAIGKIKSLVRKDNDKIVCILNSLCDLDIENTYDAVFEFVKVYKL